MTSRILVPLVLIATLAAGGCGGSTPTQNTSRVAAVGDLVLVNYSLWLFSDTAAQNKGTFLQSGSFTFQLGVGQVVKGFDQGVTGMTLGDKKLIVVPPELGYGSAGFPAAGIPPDATLVFEVDLLGIQR